MISDIRTEVEETKNRIISSFPRTRDRDSDTEKQVRKFVLELDSLIKRFDPVLKRLEELEELSSNQKLTIDQLLYHNLDLRKRVETLERDLRLTKALADKTIELLNDTHESRRHMEETMRAQSLDIEVLKDTVRKLTRTSKPT